jgi:hypothetical protein
MVRIAFPRTSVLNLSMSFNSLMLLSGLIVAFALVLAGARQLEWYLRKQRHNEK